MYYHMLDSAVFLLCFMVFIHLYHFVYCTLLR